MCQCISCLIHILIVKTYYDCRRLLRRLCVWIHSCQPRYASPEVNFFHAVRLPNEDLNDFTYLRTCRRMGVCLSARSSTFISKSSSQRNIKQRPDTIDFDFAIAAPLNTFEQHAMRTSLKKMYRNGASNVACMFTQKGRKRFNQDAMIVWEGCALDDTIFCGVFDGHGPNGHLVAQNVRDLLPLKLISFWKAAEENSTTGEECPSLEREPRLEEEGCLLEESDWYSSWRASFVNGYKLMDTELRTNCAFDCYRSGTTAVTLIKKGHDVIIGNVGDSRAVLGTRSDDGSILAVQLTVDLKPDLPQEAERIRRCKGRVFALDDEPEVKRVWLPHNNSSGLAMARAFGDFCFKEYGVIAVPEVTYRRLTEKDEFIVLATDGVWNVLSNEQVVQIVSSVSSRQLAAKALVETAVRTWRLKYSSKVDDCAVICLYLDTFLSISFPYITKQNNGANQTDLLLDSGKDCQITSQSLNNLSSKSDESAGSSSQQNFAIGVDNETDKKQSETGPSSSVADGSYENTLPND